METENLICPSCHLNVQETGVVRVEMGLTQRQPFCYHPQAELFVADERLKANGIADTSWHCRSCGQALPREFTAYLATHTCF